MKFSKEVRIEAARINFIDYLRWLADYWSRPNTKEDKTPKERIMGAFHSLLVEIDGCGDSEGAKIIWDGVEITKDVHLHDMLYPENKTMSEAQP